jgi:hydrophobe/amphiphile efflux-1 (HAE1) family protein
MSITGLAIKRPILFVVFFILLAGAGLFAYNKLNYELLPDLATPYVTVATVYPGASPKEVENSVTKKIEEGVAGVGKIKKMSSTSSENLSVVTLEFLADVNPDAAIQEVQRAVSKVLPEMPAGVKSPSIEKLNVNDVPVLRLGVTANGSENELYDVIKNQVKPRLAQIKNTGRVTILGGAEKEVKIAVNQKKMTSYGITALELSDVIRKNNGDFPVGNIKDNDAGLGIRISGKIININEVANIVIRSLPDGSSIQVKDIADVTIGTKEIEVLNRVSGKASVGLFINKQSGSNAVALSAKIKEELAKIENDYQNIGLKFSIAQDSSEFTLDAANAVYKDFFIAVLLVALVMLVFLHSIRNAAIVMLAIPTSLFSAFIMMYFLNYSLNLMTLLAMSLVIGVLVDDSIVVLENIYRHLEMGKDKKTASLEGRNEIGFAALSITLVDVVVFLPMALVPGLIGSLVKQFSLVIVVSTLSSLVVSFTLTPMIASRFAKLEHPNPKNIFGKISLFFERRIHAFTNWYEGILKWSLKHKLATLGITLALLVGSFMLVSEGFVGAEFAPATDKGELSLLINMQPGTKLFSTNEAVKKIEEKLKTVPEITKTFTTVGYMNDGFADNYASNLGAVNISLTSANKRTKSLSDLAREIKALAMQVPGVKARVSAIGLFGANDAPIQLMIYGNNRDKIFEVANTIIDTVRNITGISSPRLLTEQGKPEIDITLDKAKTAALGIDPELIGANLRTAINGYDELKFRAKENEVNIRIQLREDERNSTNAIPQYSFVNNKGQTVYLNQFATINLKSSPSTLERSGKQASVMIMAQVTGRPSGDVGNDIKEKLKNYQFPDGIKISYEGDLALQDDSFGQLGIALVSSILLIYLIMVALYNNWSYPFVVLFAIPVAVVGAFLALALTAKSLSIFTIFGLIMMMGLVAKNAILLVDRANDARREGMNLWDALIDAGRTRLRPILMTTLAMVIGMLPLALAKGAGAELNTGLAWVLIGGLTSSMFLTLVVVPVMYYSITRLMEKLSKKNKETNSINNASTAIVVKTMAIVFFLSTSINSQAQTKQLSLSEAIRIGTGNNRQLLSAQLDAAKASFATKEVSGNLLPVINATSSYTRNIKVPVFFFPSFGVDPNTGGLVIDDKNLQPIAANSKNTFQNNLNFSIPVWNAEVNAGIKMAKANEDAIKANIALTKAQIIDEIRKAYYNVLLAKASVELIEQTITRAYTNLESSKSLLRQGMAMDADTLSAFVNYQSLLANRIKAANSITTSSNYLKFLIAIPMVDTLALTDTLNSENSLQIVTTKESNYDKRPEILINKAQHQLALKTISFEKSKYLPGLGLVSQYNIQAQSNDFKLRKYVWPNSWYLGVQVNIPIFNGFKTSNRINQAKLGLQQTEIQRQHLIEQIKLEVTNAKITLDETHKIWLATKNTIPSAERNVQLITSRWQKGLAKYSEVADSELTLTQARNNELKAIYDYLMAKAAWLKATGNY